MTTSPAGSQTISHTVRPLAQPERVDRYLAGCEDLALTRSKIQKLITDGLITLSGKPLFKGDQVAGGETLQIIVPPPEKSSLAPEDIALELVYEDDFLAVINKPAGLVTHPAPGNRSATLVNALLHRYGALPNLDGAERPGIVHRLDKATTGLLLVARREDTLVKLQEALRSRTIRRAYLALVCGHLPKDADRLDFPIARSPRDRKKMAVVTGGREAVTEYRVQERFRSYDLARLELQTGRTHQIRVHLAHIGHPVLGDPEYGGREKWHRGLFAPERLFARTLLELIHRQALHAYQLRLTHPHTGQPLAFELPVPPDFGAVLEQLRAQGR